MRLLVSSGPYQFSPPPFSIFLMARRAQMEKTLKPLYNKRMKQSAILAALASQLMAAPSYAETLNPLVVTAGRMAEDIGQVSSDVTVLDEERIENSQAQNVAELLSSEAGIDIAANGGPGKLTSLFLRGANSGQTLVLIDGVRVGAVTNGSFDWGKMSTLNVERIEIVRGPQSTLYGADAMGGVIQIFTKQGKGENRTTVDAEYSSRYADQSLRLQTQGGSDSGLSYALAAENRSSDGFSVAANGTEADGYKLTSYSANIAMPLGKGDLQLTTRHHKAANDLDGGFPFGDVLNFTNDATQDVLTVKGNYVFSDNWDSSLQISQSIDESIGSDPVNAGNNSDFKTTITQLTWQNHLELDEVSMLVGIDAHKDSGVSQSAGLDQSMTQQALFASVFWGNGLFDLNLSARRDQNSVSADKTTYKAGVAHHPLQGLKLFANYGTGFKAPSLNDLYWPATAFSAGNPNLLPEESKGWDAGVEFSHQGEIARSQITAVRFKQRFSNLIEWAETSPWFWQPSNVAGATTRGYELSALVEYEKAFIRANWTNLDATNDADGTRLARRAKDSGSVTFGGDVAGVHAEAQINFVGSRFSGTGETDPMAKYTTTDIRLAYQLNETFKLKARVENAENSKYEQVSGYGVAGRATYLGISATF